MLLRSHGVNIADFTSPPKQHVVEFAVQGVLRSSACKFSEEKINQITLCSESIFRDETLIFA